jgi:hypothetical protein
VISFFVVAVLFCVVRKLFCVASFAVESPRRRLHVDPRFGFTAREIFLHARLLRFLPSAVFSFQSSSAVLVLRRPGSILPPIDSWLSLFPADLSGRRSRQLGSLVF